ncbi:3-hydroxy-3-methylglutaryl-coenzyme A reductase [Cryptotermes secundus]|uniref:3-hydroxy-3-methylglutaryl coenzyme A reductase n=2 Tax=Cryptotermes secundus TaxID=105785 RepID=A0A2J7R3S8_9NEOP|nr:3-hydroxy-3-methylglutaryl-coenzyme A reductase [Cryptotermes secundus]XP_023705724.1 3-hydroxy-3-methylglutaryl-coenzyme A reductase [Cryptotermes secundus]PNF35485.1 3-hydroxy-3-methylglutaryl-coenzyme A reductase [Cryptotermes secundus]PNF35486.1 3-hydroxy-3-methylglutaryl-coenzyme A reductase [Cryptotermes secundus]
MVGWLFRAYGEVCASHPWEVIVATLTLTVCMLTVDQRPLRLPPDPYKDCDWRNNCSGLEDYNAADMIVMTLIRCVAILYTYYQFCNLQKLGSKYILGIAGLFTVFSSFVFSSSVINFLGSDISDLKDALFFFLLLIDLSKATVLAQFALSSRSQDEVKHNIAHGIAMLGPTITLDTIVETLVIGVGTLSGVWRLNVLCCFACMSVVVNYIMFMTFYPSCLSLILELSQFGESGWPTWHDSSFIMRALYEEDQKPNPVVQRVKVIMSAGLMLVHAHSRWSFAREEEALPVVNLVTGETIVTSKSIFSSLLEGYNFKWLTVSADHIVILILVLALVVKFVFFDLTNKFQPGDRADTYTRMLAVEGWVEVSAPPRAEGSVVPTEHKGVQTEQEEPIQQTPSCGLLEEEPTGIASVDLDDLPTEDRSLEECLKIYKSTAGASALNDSEVMALVAHGYLPSHQLEKAVGKPERGVCIRRKILGVIAKLKVALTHLPYLHYDYSKVMGACCENVIGYMPIPVGVAGPLLLDGRLIHVPLATTEGCLVASANRGCRALMRCGITSRIVGDGMTRGPVVRFPNISRASDAMKWMETPQNFQALKESFDSSSRFARLLKIQIRVVGRLLYIRFVATTGDAMGMNMLSKGTEVALGFMRKMFQDMEIVSLSGNFCIDKKPAALNWIEGRGKSVVCEALVPADVVSSVLKTTVHALVDLNINKNLVGSAVAGSIGGFNSHAANIVTAIFIATGQDPAQNVGSSNCMMLMEPRGEDGRDLYVSCTMPSLEVGTVGGGTVLPPQAACLEMLGVRGANRECPGDNAKSLAQIVCGTVLAAELSLMSALTAGDLVKSHLQHNRAKASAPGSGCGQ